jgi:hypothetical protein
MGSDGRAGYLSQQGAHRCRPGFMLWVALE